MHTDVDGGAGAPAADSPGKAQKPFSHLIAWPGREVADAARTLTALYAWCGENKPLPKEMIQQIDHWASPDGVAFAAGAVVVANNLVFVGERLVEATRSLERIEKLLERLNDSLDDEVIELPVTGEAVPS